MTEARSAVAVIVMGVSGSGKSTIGALLAGRIGVDFLDADDLHPATSRSKMTAGIALTDEDRMPWLRRVAEAIEDGRTAGRGVVVACSALRRRYRDALRATAGELIFIHLAGTRERLADRLERRVDHFASPRLLDSQLSTLEPLEPDERGITIDITAAPRDVVAELLARWPEQVRIAAGP